MTNLYVQDGESINHIAATDLAVNSVIVIGSRIAVVIAGILSGATGAVGVKGVFRLPKVVAADLSEGESIQFDVGAGMIASGGATAAAGDLVNCGVVVTPAANGVTTVEVDINVPGAIVTP